VKPRRRSTTPRACSGRGQQRAVANGLMADPRLSSVLRIVGPDYAEQVGNLVALQEIAARALTDESPEEFPWFVEREKGKRKTLEETLRFAGLQLARSFLRTRRDVL
jgi:hypothetical protein